MKSSRDRTPTMIEVPPARIPEEPVAVIQHAGICEGGRLATGVSTLICINRESMQRYPLKFSALILGAYIVLHGLLEFHVIHRGIMIPTLWEMLEWALTFPLSIWQFFFGLPDTTLARLIYYVFVIANSLFLGLVIRKMRQNSSNQEEAESGPGG
jgi:hypothetical protein